MDMPLCHLALHWEGDNTLFQKLTTYYVTLVTSRKVDLRINTVLSYQHCQWRSLKALEAYTPG